MATAIHQEIAYIQPHQSCVTNDVASDVTDDDIVSETTDLHLVKEVSERLNLATRRPSTIQWKQVIEFRKSMGLYSSDVEPEYLDKIVEEKLKTGKSGKRRKKPQSTSVPHEATKSDQSSENESTCAEEDRKNNNIVSHADADEKSGKSGRKVKYFRKSTKQSKKTDKIVKKLLLTGEKSNHNSMPSMPSPLLNDITFKLTDQSINTQTETNPASNCDVTKDLEASPSNEPIETADISLYDSGEESDEDVSSLSETAKRYRGINKALAKIRRDLITMRMEDNKLARKLLDARSEINIIKAQQSCDAYADVIDDVTYELEEEDMMPGLFKACDLSHRPPGSLLSALSPLRNIGISRMNLNRRRFSIR